MEMSRVPCAHYSGARRTDNIRVSVFRARNRKAYVKIVNFTDNAETPRRRRSNLRAASPAPCSFKQRPP
eukprot:6381494-Prymnesium_polylepis.1